MRLQPAKLRKKMHICKSPQRKITDFCFFNSKASHRLLFFCVWYIGLYYFTEIAHKRIQANNKVCVYVSIYLCFVHRLVLLYENCT